MRQPISIVVLLLLLGGCQPDEREAAVRLEVTYSAKPGCITVLARDTRAPHGEANSQVDGDRLDGTSLSIAIFRQKSWSHTLEIITTAHEQSCDGLVVAKDERQVQLNSAGVQSTSVRLEIMDEDGDGYMPVSVGGTDCDDGWGGTHPHAAEVCDDRDNDCNGSADDGVSTNWYADQDGDGFGDKRASPVLSCTAPAGPLAYVSDKADCDDMQQDTHPGAVEACDSRDNDCDGSVDEEVAAWHPDRDGDGFGDMLASPIMSCAGPAGPIAYVRDATDCLDSNPNVHPRPEGSETTCNDVDDDCDGAIDDGFPAKGTECSDPCPNGRFVCSPRGDRLICDADGKVPLYSDKDLDGAGDEVAQPQGEICPRESPPSGTVFNRDDCDDQDPHNRRNQMEVCDGRDNNCDSQKDEANVCRGKGWDQVNDQALKNNRNWRTVALRPGGQFVWVAGLGGTLAVRFNPGETFVSKDGSCGMHDWRSAWVRPSDGHVFLAGDDGFLAEHDGTNCIQVRISDPGNDLTGLVGFVSDGATVLYVVDSRGRLYVWTPGSQPQERYNMYPPAYFGIHGTQSDLLVVGGAFENAQDPRLPRIDSYPGSGGAEAVRSHELRGIPNDYVGELHAVWMAQPSLAYAVGDNGLVLKWDGAEGWERVLPPAAPAAANFTSVVVLDISSIYVTDTNGSIRRLTGSGWVDHPFYDTDKPLRDIALDSPGEIWAVGDDGRVIHFPQ
jgi:hypothetical protein